MPHGIEETSGNEPQTKRLRINANQSLGLRLEDSSVTRGASPDGEYDCGLYYKLEQALGGVYIGDGVPNKEGSSFYLPIASPPAGKIAEVLKINANDLSVTAHDSREASGMFVTPNSVAVTRNHVIAILKNNHVYVYDHELAFSRTVPVAWQDVIASMKSSPNDTKFYTLGMQFRGVGVKHSYSFAVRSLMEMIDEKDLNLDAQKGFRTSRLADAPAWVTPQVSAPMDVSAGILAAVCVEGGVFLIDLKKKVVMEVAIDATEREEAVLIDPEEPAVFCAHARRDTEELKITRINTTNVSDTRSNTLPSRITYMVNDTSSTVRPAIWYNRARAVSMALTRNSLFVSHGTKIYMLSKSTMAVQGQITLDLPCRLIQVRRGKAPGGSHPVYGDPKDCYLVWAIGASYNGNGQTLEKFKTSLYKLAFA
jgi:hypothetical protein